MQSSRRKHEFLLSFYFLIHKWISSLIVANLKFLLEYLEEIDIYCRAIVSTFD